MKNKSVFNSATYNAFYNTIANDQELRDSLNSVIIKHNALHKNPHFLIKSCMLNVANYEYVKDCAINGDIMQVFDDTLESRFAESDDRIRFLSGINFVFETSADPKKRKFLTDPQELKRLFEGHMATQSEANETEDKLKSDIKANLSKLCLSDRFFTDFTHQLEKEDDVLSLTADLVEKDYRVKCIAAMENFLSGKCSTMEEAACTACHDSDLKIVTAAAKRGELTANELKDWALILGIILLALAAVIIVGTPLLEALGLTVSSLVSVIAVALAICGVAAVVAAKPLANAVGRSVTHYNYNKAAAKAKADAEYDDFVNDFASCSAYEEFDMHADAFTPEYDTL